MTVHPCPSCRQLGFAWSIDEEQSPNYQWRCHQCGYDAAERETTQLICPTCKSDGVVRSLTDTDGTYTYCFNCFVKILP